MNATSARFSTTADGAASGHVVECSLKPLELLLRERHTDRMLLGGTATELCVAQAAISARELGFKVTVLKAACASVNEAHERLALHYLEQIAGC